MHKDKERTTASKDKESRKKSEVNILKTLEMVLKRKIHEYLEKNKEESMNHYPKRSNAETVFAMIKRKLGMKLRN